MKNRMGSIDDSNSVSEQREFERFLGTPLINST